MRNSGSGKPPWKALTREVTHRPWPLPARRWLMTMSWLDLLFAHWRVEPQRLASLLPRDLELDTFAGAAYLGVVPFHMERVGPRWLAGLPERAPLRAFPEINVRTYVVQQGKPGVFFLSLDATSALAVETARLAFHLPYFNARIRVDKQDGWIVYDSRRSDRRLGPGVFRARYRPTGTVFRTAPGSLEHWLTERYGLYTADRRGRTRRADVHHLPWPLQPAVAEIAVNTVAEAHGFDLSDPPALLHFAARLDVVAWGLEAPAQPPDAAGAFSSG